MFGSCGSSDERAPVVDRGYPVWDLRQRDALKSSRTSPAARSRSSDTEAVPLVSGSDDVVVATAIPYTPSRSSSSGSSEAGSTNSAVLGLMKRAKQQLNQGDEEGAAASLERALRIEPRNGVLWHNLAVLRLRQQDYGQAESLARKSISFSGNKRALKARSWELVAAARRGKGNEQGARAAEKEARRYE
ncbi:tetratricopeptide repeat protein [Candidatus Reidiella endopervernicosa]|uniref:Tetratricopeptide repeat protein n=1 Tax=Candidatus Reidiella endopervernicosa TaxID=2738883 RepID=A0A6N0HWY1_9GAMM|nr:tetratricopeptide repeat protein [Candidatus Reidiella endopervernicosa]QKQ26878.1 tetratricopeptide repeat protein [Candidatus Reidiella endopervernicosa]